jgi:hypothetical protein
LTLQHSAQGQGPLEGRLAGEGVHDGHVGVDTLQAAARGRQRLLYSAGKNFKK